MHAGKRTPLLRLSQTLSITLSYVLQFQLDPALSSWSGVRILNVHLECECSGKDDTEKDEVLANQRAAEQTMLAIRSNISCSFLVCPGLPSGIDRGAEWGDLLVDRTTDGRLPLKRLARSQSTGNTRRAFKYHFECMQQCAQE
jgi:hypothetical protein